MNHGRLAELHRELSRLHLAIAAEYAFDAGEAAGAPKDEPTEKAPAEKVERQGPALAIGLSFDDTANVYPGECFGDGPNCACEACRLLESFICACGKPYLDHGACDGTVHQEFRLAAWLNGPAVGMCKGKKRHHRRDDNGKCAGCGFPMIEQKTAG